MNIAQRLVLISVFCWGAQGFAQTEDAQELPISEALPEVSAENTTQAPVETPTEQPTAEQVSADPADQASKKLLKTVINKYFNKPLFFDQKDHGVTIPPIEVEYDLTLQEGKALKIGNVVLNESNFFFALAPLGKSHSQINQVLTRSEANRQMLLISWPDKLLSYGTIEMISRTGTVLWSYNFTIDQKKNWTKTLEEWRRALIARGISAQELGRGGLFGTQLGIDIESTNAPFLAQKDSFRFCISQTLERNSTKICSQKYGTKSSGKSVIMGKVRQEIVSPRVLVQNESGALKNSVPLAPDVPASFYSELASGESYEFVVVPPKLELMDISDTKNPGIFKIIGYDTRPLGKSIVLNPDQYSALTKALGFEATIGDRRKFWATTIKKSDPKIYLQGKGGGVFKQRFEPVVVPRQQARLYLHRRTPSGTYIDGIELEGRKQPISELRTEQNSVQIDSQDPSLFVWSFKATERGKMNRSYLDVDFEGKTYRSYFELYKGYPRELSGRFTGVSAADAFIFLGEVAYNQWFEDLFGWTNYWVSRQRWGVSAKYFQSFNELKVNAAGDTAPLSVLTVDLKFRAAPGLWGRDETVGGLVSYQNVTFDVLKAPMLGFGAFWARSMPKVFDDLFNIVPLMRYPKWVDMEFIYYPTSMDSKIKLNAPMSLNFHGKVLWSDWLFGEAGFGMKRYSYTDITLQRKAELNTFYGTVGLGINF